MENPFNIHYADEQDAKLVTLAIAGDKKALQQLVIRHQIFVHNLALKMTRNTENAEDLTQEVFIKAITALGKFEGKSNFRTWLYRITVNHFLNTRKQKSEIQVSDFEAYFNSIDAVPAQEISKHEQESLQASVEELRINCTAGMLLCLDRPQRMIYILGEMFDIDHRMGAEIMGITSGNFRIRLMRARQDLYNWMNKRCGLVNTANPCRCARKTKGYIEAGLVDSQHLRFNTDYKVRIFELSKKEAATVTATVEDLYKKVFLEHPLQEPRSSKKIVNEIVNNELIRSLLQL